MTDLKSIRQVAVVGTGVIGASWSALFLAKGLQVVATDPAQNAERTLRRFVESAWPTLERLGLSPGAARSNLRFTGSLAEAVSNADLVQENGPERIGFQAEALWAARRAVASRSDPRLELIQPGAILLGAVQKG